MGGGVPWGTKSTTYGCGQIGVGDAVKGMGRLQEPSACARPACTAYAGGVAVIVKVQAVFEGFQVLVALVVVDGSG